MISNEMAEKKTVKDGRDLYRRYAERSAATLDPERDPKALAGYALFDRYDQKSHYTSRTTTKKENS